ncbi:MAG: DUF4276 family protein [Verrucomicrobiota bacterium]
MKTVIFIEGGAKASRDMKIRCQQAFHKLLAKMELPKGRSPGLIACGSRNDVYDRFCIELNSRNGSFAAMWIDSEKPVSDPENPWEHLRQNDKWQQPDGVVDDQVLLMTTCMETWIVADRESLRTHYGRKLQESALPPLHELERRAPHDLAERLTHATRNCSNAFSKGKRSFEILATLSIAALEPLPSFARILRILKTRL